MRALLPVAALLLSVAFLLTGQGLQGVLVPVRASFEGFSAIEIALIGSCYFAGLAAGSVFGPAMVKRAGHIRAFTAMTAAASTGVLLQGMLVLPLVWWLLRALSGFCFAVLYIVIESWLNERATSENRGFVLSAYMIINLTVLTVGQLLLPLGTLSELTLFAIVAIFVSIAAIPIALTASVAPAPAEWAKISVRQLYRISPVGIVGCAVVGCTNGAFWAMAPLFAESAGFGTTGIALFMSSTVLGGALGQWPLGHLSDRIDRRRVMILAAVFCMITAMLLVFRPFGSGLVVLLMAASWGAFSFPLYSVAVAHANDYAPPDQFVQVSSGLLLVYGGGAIVGPVAASIVTSLSGDAYLYAFTSLMHAGLVLFAARRIWVRHEADAEDHIHFIDALQAVRTVSAVFDLETQEKLESDTESGGSS